MAIIIGISAFYHDSAAALVSNGKILAAAQEERFTRKKHDASFPINSINFILSTANLSLSDVDYVVFYEKPFLKFERLIETYLATAPMGFHSFSKAMPIWLKEKLFLKDYLLKKLRSISKEFSLDKLLFSEHHLSHAASAFYPSPFSEAVVLTLDGVGEWATTTVAIGKESKLKIIKEIKYPHSLGLLYSAFTYYAGFRVNSGEYKLMGLAPYGTPKYKSVILDNLIDVKEDGSFRLNQAFFNYSTGLTMTNQKFSELFSHPVRKPDVEKLDIFHMDIAASIQSVTEDILLRMTGSLASEFDIPNLCLAGGVALNCVANGKILRDRSFKELWIQPAAGDAGGAIGAALAAEHIELKQPRTIKTPDNMRGSYFGPEYSQNEIESLLERSGAIYTVMPINSIISNTAKAIGEGKAVGWFQGKMEFGPRALGNRSILGDPRNETMQAELNLKIKFRESFRPFAASVLAEDASKWFDLHSDSPYMLIVTTINAQNKCEIEVTDSSLTGLDKLKIKRSHIPAVTHVDYSSRIQTVHKETNPLFHALISEFKQQTGCPILINTSFNIRGEPIVCTPNDAFRCFMGTNLDVLVIGNCYLKKEMQKESIIADYGNQYELD